MNVEYTKEKLHLAKSAEAISGPCDDEPENPTKDFTDEELDLCFKAAVKAEFERSRLLKLPVCKYDYEKHRSYILYPDGRRDYGD